MRKTVSFLLLMAVFSSQLLVSCKSDEDKDPGTPPEIPEVETFLMDFSDFNDGASSDRVGASANWSLAALKVGVWNIVIGVTFAIPVAAFKASLNSAPEYDNDLEAWIWNFDYDFVGRTFSSELRGVLDGNQVYWEMYISQENGFQDFLWYSGVSNVDGTGGEWTLYGSIDEPNPVLQIDWEKTADEVGNIRYSNISGNSGNGSYIEYGRSDDPDFNTFYFINNTDAGNEVDIQWNRDSKNGRIKDPAFYNDEEFHCWDSSFEDVDC